MSATSRLQAAYAHRRYGILFYTLLLSLAVSPVIRPLGLSGNVVEIFLAANLLAAVLALGPGRLRTPALAALALALMARPLAAWLNEQVVSTASLALWGVVALLAAASALVYALRGQTVGREQIYAALSVYLLVGLFFGVLYWVIDQLVPASVADGGAAPPGGIAVSTAIYYSFVTLASLGYGDVLALSDPARGLAVLEAVGGQLYLAVMVARLVSAWR